MQSFTLPNRWSARGSRSTYRNTLRSVSSVAHPAPFRCLSPLTPLPFALSSASLWLSFFCLVQLVYSNGVTLGIPRQLPYNAQPIVSLSRQHEGVVPKTLVASSFRILKTRP